MVALYVLLFLVLAVLLASAYCFRLCFYSPKDRKEDPYKPLEGEQYEKLNLIALAKQRILLTSFSINFDLFSTYVLIHQ